MKHALIKHRYAIAALSAAVLLPFNPVSAQDMPLQDPPVVNVPPPPITAPAPPPPTTAQPPITKPIPSTPPISATPPPPAEAPAARPTRSASQSVRRAPRSVQPRAEQAARPAATAAPARPAPAPAAESAVPSAPPPAATAPTPLPVPATEAPAQAGTSLTELGPWLLAGAALLIGALFLFARRRRRVEEEPVHDTYDEEPRFAAAPRETIVETPPVAVEPELAYLAPGAAAAAAAVPAAMPDEERVEPGAEPVTSVEKLESSEPAAADVEALAASSEPAPNRPWLEFLMRPVRAGTTAEDARVEFELTVSNTGSVPARDVRISTFMFAAGSAQESEMEQMLIDLPADATVSEDRIDPGDGTRVDGALTLPKAGLPESVVPVVVADARYLLPDGSEGRTRAAFEVGLPGGEVLDPFPTDRASGLLETVEARLHGELERV